MDPLSIATASASLAGFCVKLSTIIYNFIDKSQHVERTVQVLRVEIDSLSQVLTSISVNFNDHSLAKTALDSQTGHEAQHWKNFEGLMNDCKEALEALEHVLEPMKRKSRLFARPVKQFKLEQRSREIELLKQQIAAYRQTMSLSLQLITVNKQVNTNLIARLDDLTTQIERLQQMFRTQTNSQVVDSIRESVISAARIVTAASSMVSTRSGGSADKASVIQEDWSEQLRKRIENWIPTIEEETQVNSPITTLIPETTFSGESEPPRDALQYDREAELIQTWRKSAIVYYQSHQYDEAKRFLERLLTRSMTRYGKNFEGEDEIRRVLSTCCCWVEDWHGAEKIVHTEFEGRLQAIELLAMCYIHASKWDEAEKVLMEVDTEEQTDGWKMHTLAEVYKAKGDFEAAILWCTRAMDLRVATVGRNHVLFYMSLSLLGQIYEAQDDQVEAEGYRNQLPVGIQECLDLEKLRFMRPDKAASAVEQMFSPTFASLPVKWDEIRDNIQKSGNGTVGSGYGYCLFHAFVQLGNELALNFLIEKGADVNAKTKQGNTALHLAIHARHEVVVRLLMENGADIEATDAYGRTPLISAVKSGIDQIVALLLEMRANTEAKDSSEETALIVAAKMGSKVMVQKLLDGGANSGDGNYRQGRTPRDVAAQRGFLEVAEMLHTAGNRKMTWTIRRAFNKEDDEYKRQVRLSKSNERQKERTKKEEIERRDKQYLQRADKVSPSLFSPHNVSRIV